ncbi:MAG: glycosyltransferase family 39 protein, partial [Anaerolineales bacterium]|nr:glycosyltransferase family 39 protein [Anaerolineales bacterium]
MSDQPASVELAPPDAAPRLQPAPAPRPVSWRGFFIDALLIILIGVGVYFRFSWTNWSQGTDIHPDEYGLTSTLTRLRIPATWDEWFNTRLSPISPYQKYDAFGNPTEPGPDNRMRWGQWPIILLKWGAEVTGNTGYGEQRLFGRQFSALADTLALAVLFLIGARLYNRRVGLLAAALSALAVMQIQQSHFMTADNFGVLFTALALYAAVRVAQAPPAGRASWGWAALFGVFFGMCLASRINLAPLAGLIVVAAALAHRAVWERAPGAALQRGLLLCVLAGLVALLTFRVTQPMAFRAKTGDTTIFTVTPNQEWLDSLAVAQSESSGVGGGPPGEQWTNRPALVFPWINMVVWGMGWPLGLAAWAGLAWAAWRLLKSDWAAQFATHIAPHALPVIWVGGYFLFMGTRWVKSVRYFLPIYPFLALLAAWALVELWEKGQGSKARGPGLFRPLSVILTTLVLAGTLAWAWGFTSLYRTDNTRIQASRWIYQNIPGPLSLQLSLPEGGAAVEPVAFPNGQELVGDVTYRAEFRLRAPATLTGLSAARVRNLFDATIAGTLQVVVAADPAGEQMLAAARLPVAPDTGTGQGQPASAPVAPVALDANRPYYLLVSAPEGGPLQVLQTVVANESWDEGVPLRVDGRDAFGGLYRGLTMEVRWQDDVNKREMLLTNLAQADYVFLPSQRAIWAASRLPAAYPLTMEYYRALFDGRLGFELAAQFQSPITIGPLQVSDVAGTWAWGQRPRLNPNATDPFNDNIWAAEEAFSVYDHAPVWIFRKRPDFSLDQARAVLEAVDLTQVVNQGPVDATRAPTLLMLPSDLLANQRAGGTWSAMFDLEGALNTNQPLAVAVWYLTLLVIGWLAFPLTFVALGGLPDKGYPLAKSVALLVVAWLVWLAGSLRLAPFTQGTIALAFLALGLVSLAIGWARRAELAAYGRDHWRHLVGVELVGLGLFALMLFIRAGNPDLWHPYFGGEKPMDFSYFNAVLKSTYFPPYDPWLAGGYLNYYYYGFVVAGLLTKLLGVMPSLAYNLILPMLFSLVGVNAFGVAYNL